MPQFRCLIMGENFRQLVKGKPERIGFYLTRWIDAPDEVEAERMVVANLRDEPALAKPEWYDGSEPRPSVRVEEIEEVSEEDICEPSGLVYFPMED